MLMDAVSSPRENAMNHQMQNLCKGAALPVLSPGLPLPSTGDEVRCSDSETIITNKSLMVFNVRL